VQRPLSLSHVIMLLLATTNCDASYERMRILYAE